MHLHYVVCGPRRVDVVFLITICLSSFSDICKDFDRTVPG